MIQKSILLAFCFMLFSVLVPAQKSESNILPVRGLCVAAPNPDGVDRFVKFIEEELAPRGINTLILRVDFNYQYISRPELANAEGLSKQDIEKMVETCRKHQIRLIPQINLLGHQSWASTLGKLLEVYPQFDETPQVALPETYKWPNDDGLYCKSYCPLHPEVHEVAFDLVDEICDAFQSDAFHAGMDEVFYLGDDKCPRCSGRDKAELFAGEVTKIRNHLDRKNRQLWIWGDRLIDGKTTGMGIWEASFNNTYRAIDMIPKDVMICDWHYERPDQTPVYFAMKGLQVVTCSWRNPKVAVAQINDMYRWRETATNAMQPNYQGILHTIWSGNADFLNQFYGISEHKNENGLSPIDCFKQVFKTIAELKK